MAGTITVSTISDGTNSTSSTNCIQGSAKAWVNFNGSATSGSGTIRASYNISSITIGGSGVYTFNFTTALADANYAVIGIGSNTTGDGTCFVQSTSTNTSSAAYINCKAYGAALVNGTYNYLAFYR